MGEIEKAQSKMINTAPLIAIGYATVYSIVAVDLYVIGSTSSQTCTLLGTSCQRFGLV